MPRGELISDYGVIERMDRPTPSSLSDVSSSSLSVRGELEPEEELTPLGKRVSACFALISPMPKWLTMLWSRLRRWKKFTGPISGLMAKSSRSVRPIVMAIEPGEPQRSAANLYMRSAHGRRSLQTNGSDGHLATISPGPRYSTKHRAPYNGAPTSVTSTRPGAMATGA